VFYNSFFFVLRSQLKNKPRVGRVTCPRPSRDLVAFAIQRVCHKINLVFSWLLDDEDGPPGSQPALRRKILLVFPPLSSLVFLYFVLFHRVNLLHFCDDGKWGNAICQSLPSAATLSQLLASSEGHAFKIRRHLSPLGIPTSTGRFRFVFVFILAVFTFEDSRKTTVSVDLGSFRVTELSDICWWNCLRFGKCQRTGKHCNQNLELG